MNLRNFCLIFHFYLFSFVNFQVEMCLLGYSLGVRIQVFRLKQFREEDFISFYPEDGTDDWPIVSLIAEDDRHYNVPVL